jgi:hypothetical protein
MSAARPSRAGVIAIAGLLAVAAGCGGGGEDRPIGAADSTASAPIGDAPAPAAPPDTMVRQPSYRVVRIPDAKALRRLHRELGADRFLLALKVNRRDSVHVRMGDSLMVPDSTATLLDLSPFPRQIPSTLDQAKLVLISRRVQAFAAYEAGRLARWGPTSTGRESLQTPAGLYHTNWKDQERTSTFNDEWLLKWYVNLDNFLGISFHLYELPGYPASHSCVRLLEDDAIWLYDWVEQWQLDPTNRRKVLRQGTPVVVFGQYGFGKKAPWRKLAADSTATNVPLAEVDGALDAYLRSGARTPIDSVRTAALLAIREARARASDSARAAPESIR